MRSPRLGVQVEVERQIGRRTATAIKLDQVTSARLIVRRSRLRPGELSLRNRGNYEPTRMTTMAFDVPDAFLRKLHLLAVGQTLDGPISTEMKLDILKRRKLLTLAEEAELLSEFGVDAKALAAFDPDFEVTEERQREIEERALRKLRSKRDPSSGE